MAENILGLLFVTSSARGRNVFRYPPDPFSPLTRLSQPYYPSTTFTVKDTLTTADRRQLFPSDYPGHHSKRNGTTNSDRKLLREWALGGSEFTGGTEGQTGEEAIEDDGSGESSVSSEDDVDNLIFPPRVRPSDDRVATSLAARLEGSRRSSAALPDLHAERKQIQDEYLFNTQYDTALGYSLDFLGDMLTPPRSACNRKFEINVDELIFVGHPVTVDGEGKWAFPEEDDDLRPSARGRKRKDARDTRDGSDRERNGLKTVVEGKEASASPDTDKEIPPPRKEEKDDVPHLNMFHLVIILDRPDPDGDEADHDGTNRTAYGFADEVYREIAFKWTAAAFALQVKENWIAKNAWEITRLKEKCYNEGVPIMDCCRMVYDKSPLDRALNQLFTKIHQLRTRPANPLYAYLPATLNVSLHDIPISIVLSPRSVKSDEHWAHWGERDDLSSVADSDSEDGWQGTKAPDFRVEPWQALLLIEADAAENAEEISRALVGLGVGEVAAMGDGGISPGLASRRGSKEATSAEEDEGVLMRALIEAADPSKRLVDIANTLRYDLEGIILPLARDLVLAKKAILINPIQARLRTIVMPTTIVEHTSTIDQYGIRFSRLFPDLPPLQALIASVSALPRQFKDAIPAEAAASARSRQTYMEALIWLIKQDLVVQVHTRVRVYARSEIKEIAWRKLWYRRRSRWLKRLEEAGRTPMISPIDLTTPRAEKRGDPMANVPGPKTNGTANGKHAHGSTSLRPDEVPTHDANSDPGSDPDGDSDVNEDDEEDEDDLPDRYNMGFTLDEAEPRTIPTFEGTFIFKPSRAQKDEMRWLRAIRAGADEVLASVFDVCVQYFDGSTSLEEISYHTGMSRGDLEKVIKAYPEDLMTFLHP